MMQIRGVEDRVLERLLYGVDPADAESMRRLPPLRRDQFDAFLFDATRWVVGEAHVQSFAGACGRYQASNRHNDPSVMQRPVPLIPPLVTTAVAGFVSLWRTPESGEPRLDGEWFTEREANLRDELYLAIGGDRGDGPVAAGIRVYSRMWSARIGDGFVHPAVGAHIWGDIPASRAEALEHTGGPDLAGIATARALADRWQNEHEQRPTIEREIIGLAHTLGW